MDKIQITPIGVIHTPFTERKRAPRGPSSANGAEGRVVVYPEFVDGLKDLEGFSHLILVFYFDRSETALLREPHAAIRQGWIDQSDLPGETHA